MLTAQDIQAQQFHVRFRGFDVEEVDDFLDRVAETVLALTDENERLKKRLEELEQEMASMRNQEKAFQQAILSAQAIAEEMKEKSRQEAEAILASARSEAESLEQSARIEVSALEKEVDRLKHLRGEITRELKSFLEGYLAQLDRDLPSPAVNDSSSSLASPVAVEEEVEEGLYEKIELPDIEGEDAPSHEGDVIAEPPGTESSLSLEEGEAETGETIPDLNGDLVFTLEDPLDTEEEEEPLIRFDDEKPGEKGE